MPRPANPLVRERLLAAGLELMHTNGFNGCGIKEITDSAGVPKGSFYSYYASKEDFAVAVLEHYWASIDRDFGFHLRDASRRPIERVTAFFLALTDHNAHRNFTLGCLVGNMSLELADHSAEVRNKLDHIMDRWTALIAACLREARTSGDLPGDGSPEELAFVIIEAWEGAVMQGRIRQHRDSYERFATLAIPRLLGTSAVSLR
ncbi:TetR family transcriptional regulator [Streptomyces hygroscopicus]|uniref:TetR/AcrR family transcriptional regulator n=1 Tax=Streptomyces hygroscopicus TaxID=1912 RepID=UPI00224004D8|nr:TetR/AcrR family transcriptional regulator [Streptomyces hygroscopicus]MCW7944340.1 TetR family transcriptional regulator [Streptomyces hygroscopicus]